MFNCLQFLEENNLSYISNGKNVSGGWLGVNCPFCHDTGYHGGFNLNNGSYNCWKCGKHRLLDVISSMLLTSNKESYDILQKYRGGEDRPLIQKVKKVKKIKKDKGFQCKLPSHCDIMEKQHRRYLKNRGFNNICSLEKTWDLRGTCHLGSYKFRVIAPIYLNGRLISYQGRDITGFSDLKYKACSIDREKLHHKYSLYGIDKVPEDKVVVVEGITDVWKLGIGAVATFGIEFTMEQVALLNKRFKKVFILYDSYPRSAVTQADKLAVELMGLGTKVEILELEKGDPGDLTDEQAKDVMEIII